MVSLTLTSRFNEGLQFDLLFVDDGIVAHLICLCIRWAQGMFVKSREPSDILPAIEHIGVVEPAVTASNRLILGTHVFLVAVGGLLQKNGSGSVKDVLDVWAEHTSTRIHGFLVNVALLTHNYADDSEYGKEECTNHEFPLLPLLAPNSASVRGLTKLILTYPNR